MVLHFVAEFRTEQGRWYWLDEKRSQHPDLPSLPCADPRYRLSTGGLHQSFATLAEAVRGLVPPAQLGGHRARRQVHRCRRVTTTRPCACASMCRPVAAPFQITALGNRDWSLASDWSWPASLQPLPPAEAK